MHDFRKCLVNSALGKVLKRVQYPLEVMLTCVRWYGAYPLSLRHIEEMMRERGIFGHSASLGYQDGACADRHISLAQAPRWQELADGWNLYQDGW